ncbi:tRNA (5-methylaminomethyl-2-thiouridine)(34)-methyltransferase MnmD [Nereida sp. MMG025]|uniref:tRNA (5-methylaminomethyl-2-thiouridine)(34)-methyltransferase MnmD n=1 Tax=Nereida sp. MMG025 TaxID=2909981 RepID=UPI001EFFA602|nr:tRNA (5-methylaminomethyl-2-thiouridine)(34)-methyltransferase MnmD [Nereida sp. MMG025]MCF6444889.1 tRNA (5-methylaminomethyl-2-thiouridine)(34)-methyltransferase MnmD [Nereida sp. MMG025]
MNQPHAHLIWTDDETPIARAFDDPYYSLANGLAETRYVFLDGNDLPARFFPAFEIAELGFGTGLSFLTAWQAWDRSGHAGTLHFTSFEAFPMSPADTARALAPFAELRSYADTLVNWLQDPFMPIAPNVSLTICQGDARRTVPAWDGQADAWFLDGFSPAKNPELWEADLMKAVGTKTAPAGTFATYTAAGHVRQKLADAGFDVQRIKGFGRKRHMSIGTKP